MLQAHSLLSSGSLRTACHSFVAWAYHSSGTDSSNEEVRANASCARAAPEKKVYTINDSGTTPYECLLRMAVPPGTPDEAMPCTTKEDFQRWVVEVASGGWAGSAGGSTFGSSRNRTGTGSRAATDSKFYGKLHCAQICSVRSRVHTR